MQSAYPLPDVIRWCCASRLVACGSPSVPSLFTP